MNLIQPSLKAYKYLFKIPDYKGKGLNNYYNFNSLRDVSRLAALTSTLNMYA